MVEQEKKHMSTTEDGEGEGVCGGIIPKTNYRISENEHMKREGERKEENVDKHENAAA